jgi:hypothetical protein
VAEVIRSWSPSIVAYTACRVDVGLVGFGLEVRPTMPWARGHYDDVFAILDGRMTTEPSYSM